ncbi:MAG: NAD(P)-dependent oxidoreductase, partial [bacterium]
LYKDYPYPHVEVTRQVLEQRGYSIKALADGVEQVAEFAVEQTEAGRPLLIVEDGGYIVPYLHEACPELLSHVIGAVEQTTKGKRNDEKISELRFPVLAVAASEAKQVLESSHVGRAVVRNVERALPNERLAGKKSCLIGYGGIGEHIAQELRNVKMDVVVWDEEPLRRAAAEEAGLQVADSVTNAIADAWLVIGATGSTSVTETEINRFRHGSYLVSASSDWDEIDRHALENLSVERRASSVGTRYKLRKVGNPEITLLANGCPINFYRADSLPNAVIDAVLSQLFVAAAEVMSGEQDLNNGVLTNEVNELISKRKLVDRYMEFQRP